MSDREDCENSEENDSYSEDNIYCTQNPEEVENEIFVEIKRQFGQHDKENFILNLVERYAENPEQLNEIRQSMYDFAKSYIQEFPSRYLTECRQRGSGKIITEKYATDVYFIYAFTEGIVSATDFQREVMSKYKMKNISNQDMSINDKSEETELGTIFPNQNH